MDFIRDFDERVIEIENYFQFIVLIDNIPQIKGLGELKKHKIVIDAKAIFPLKNKVSKEGNYSVDTSLVKTLKATTYLLLYNLVESSLTSAMNAYFEAFSNHKLEYKKLKSEIKQIWIRYQHKNFESTKPGDIVNIIESIIDDIVEIKEHEVNQSGSIKTLFNYDAYRAKIGKSNDISGNLDARQIRVLSEIYGFKMPLQHQCDSLLVVKNNRNKLAHGENSFSDIGKKTIHELYLTKEETINYMRNVLNAIKDSISDKNYLLPVLKRKSKNK